MSVSFLFLFGCTAVVPAIMQAAKGQPPDVWKQLSDRLNEPTRCWPPVMLQLNKNDLAYWELLGFDRRYLRAEL